MFGFQKQKRENYNRTFLRKVIFRVEYPQISTIKDNSENVRILFSDIFQRFNLGKDKNFQLSFGKNESANLENLQENDSIMLRSLDGKKELHILCDNLILSIEGDEYKTYEETLKSVIEKIIQYFDLYNISTIFNLSLRKINLIEFTYGEDNHPNGILQTLLNNDVVHNDIAFPDTDKISMNMHNIDFKEDSYSLNLKYGMNTLSLERKVGQLIVDLNINNSSQIKKDNLEGEMNMLNEELYSAFYWIFNETAKKMLRNGHVK